MRPGLYIAVATALFSILCSNYLVPKANFEFQSRFAKIKRTKPTLNFEDGIFNDDFKGYEIRIDKKGADGKSIEGIIIEDHTGGNHDLINVIVAENGEMFVTADGNYFVMNLFEGVHYKELKADNSAKKDAKDKKKYPFMRTHFKEWTKVFDMSGFSFNEDLFELNRNKYDLLNTMQLINGIDSLNQRKKEKIDANHVLRTNKSNRKGEAKKTAAKKSIADKAKEKKSTATTKVNTKSKSEKVKSVSSVKKTNETNKVRQKKGRTVPIKMYAQYDTIDFATVGSLINTFKGKDKTSVLNNTHGRVSVQKDRTKRSQTSVKAYEREKQKYIYKLNEAYSWALVCIIFLFIGAPLGSIIRKGGYGYPLLFAIVFYMIFMIIVIFGQKLVKTQALNPILAAWLPCLILLPVCLYLTFMAINDAKSLDWKLIRNSIAKTLFRVD